MSRATLALEQLLRSHPEERESLRPYVDRAKAYSNECGCSMGGAFLVASLGVLVYGVLSGQLSRTDLAGTILEGAAFVFAAGIVGKLVGIGIARIRLQRMYRELTARYFVEGG
jgi:hypothetical protein